MAGAPTTTDVGPRRTRPRDVIARGALTLALLGLVLWLLLGNVAELSAVGDALASVSPADAVLLVLLLLLVQVVTASQLALTVPGLGLVRALVAVEGAAAASNVVPGPSGTATRLGMLRSWGFYTDAFARSWLFTSSLTNLTVLVMPAGAIVVVATQQDVSTGVVLAALAGLAVSAIGIVVVVMVMRSESFARRLGALTGRVVRWLEGVARRRPSEQDFVDAALRFRGSISDLWRERGVRVSAAVVGTYVLTGAIFGLSLRAVGLDSAILSLGAIAVVYTLVRLATIVNFTPGGVGVTEALYTAGLLAATGGTNEAQVVAGVFLFRGLTYAGPILLGGAALLVWRFRRSWRVHPAPEPHGAAAVGAVLADREPPA